MTTHTEGSLDLGGKLTLGFVAAMAVILCMAIGAAIAGVVIHRATEPNLSALRMLERKAGIEVSWAMREHLVPGNATNIGTLLKNGGDTLPFNATVVGSAVVKWEARQSNTATKTLIATGSRVFSNAPVRSSIAMRLTTAGHQLLERSKHLRVTAAAAFSPEGYPPVEATKTFILAR
jgi:hypothetical protein